MESAPLTSLNLSIEILHALILQRTRQRIIMKDVSIIERYTHTYAQIERYTHTYAQIERYTHTLLNVALSPLSRYLINMIEANIDHRFRFIDPSFYR